MGSGLAMPLAMRVEKDLRDLFLKCVFVTLCWTVEQYNIGEVVMIVPLFKLTSKCLAASAFR